MKQSELIQLITHPQQASVEDVAKLQSLKKEFPFFQSAHLLLSISSKKHDSGLFQQTLKSTAISIPNRARLFFLLNVNEEEKNTARVNPVTTEIKPVEVKVVEEKVVEKVKDEEVKKVEEVKPTELEHLKAIELATEKTRLDEEDELTKQVEKEVEKQLVNSFIEREVLKTPDLHKVEEQKDPGTFTGWLQALKKDSQTEKSKEGEGLGKPKTLKTNIDKKKEQAIIDKVIESNPGNIRLNSNQKFFAADNKAKESLLESEDLVTETLAKIYALQGNIAKAVRAYEILSLKFPQKSAYFASLIENLKKGI